MDPLEGEAQDRVLVVAAILGDLDAFDVLVRRYRSAVIRTARAIVAADDADDVAQESLLLAFKALPALEEPAKFPAWLHAITRRCALRFHERRRARERGRLPLDEELLRKLPALSRPVPQDRLEADLHQHLARIPPDYALALRLHFLDEMPLKRIAAFLGISLATAKWRVYQGKKLLRAQFNAIQGRQDPWKEKRS